MGDTFRWISRGREQAWWLKVNSNLLGSELEEMIAERLVQKVGSKFFGITGVSLSLSLSVFMGERGKRIVKKELRIPRGAEVLLKKEFPFSVRPIPTPTRLSQRCDVPSEPKR